MRRDLTSGNVPKALLLFSGPMILGNLLQQFYNVADTLIVGQFLGPGALAAVGSSFSLMTFLTSILLGLCMGSGVLFSMLYGAQKEEELKSGLTFAFLFIGASALLLEVLALSCIDPLLLLLQIPEDVLNDTRKYLNVIFCGVLFTFLYNFFASLLRAVGNSVVPLAFLAVSALLNIVLDLLFVVVFPMGVTGAALATVISQGISGACMIAYCFCKVPFMRISKKHLRFTKAAARRIIQYSFLTCVQQSVMNFGILLIQGLVNSFGVSVMAAFAAAVKIDAFAYMPVQDFGNAFSTFIAQNHGAGKQDRIRLGIRSAVQTALVFCVIISTAVFFFGDKLMLIFVKPEETEIIAIGAQYLRIEGACYCGIGCLFLLYGFYRGIGKPGISVLLTVVSLGTRVALAYLLAPRPEIGLLGIWWAVPTGWILADLIGIFYTFRLKKDLFPAANSRNQDV